jgi:hypothetical protein
MDDAPIGGEKIAGQSAGHREWLRFGNEWTDWFARPELPSISFEHPGPLRLRAAIRKIKNKQCRTGWKICSRRELIV